MSQDIKYYLAGPMTGLPQSNFPMFDRVAAVLRYDGFTIVSPAELDDPEVRTAALANRPIITNHTWGDFLSRDVKVLADGGIGGIVFLPDWEKSNGAKLEATVGLLKRFVFRRWDEEMQTAILLPTRFVAARLYRSFTS